MTDPIIEAMALCIRTHLHLVTNDERERATSAARSTYLAALPMIAEQCAQVAEKRRDERFAEYGTTEPDTNASYYSGKYGETLDTLDEEDEEIAQAIRALAAAKVEELTK